MSPVRGLTGDSGVKTKAAKAGIFCLFNAWCGSGFKNTPTFPKLLPSIASIHCQENANSFVTPCSQLVTKMFCWSWDHFIRPDKLQSHRKHSTAGCVALLMTGKPNFMCNIGEAVIFWCDYAASTMCRTQMSESWKGLWTHWTSHDSPSVFTRWM